MRYDTAETNN